MGLSNFFISFFIINKIKEKSPLGELPKEYNHSVLSKLSSQHKRSCRLKTLLLCLPYNLFQQGKISVTLCNITQCNPKTKKIKVHKLWATGQWSKRWSTYSPLSLHMQHQLTSILFISVIPYVYFSSKSVAHLVIIILHVNSLVLPNIICTLLI